MSIPFYGYLAFPHNVYLRSWQERNRCQFPSTGILHFYDKVEDKAEDKVEGVNSLLRVSCISTKGIWADINTLGWCQFPSTGILHFYYSYFIARKYGRRCVNSLLRVSCISTYDTLKIDYKMFKVSIPFYGYLAFLLTPEGKFSSTRRVCQFPSTGILHFYLQILNFAFL